MQVDGSAALQFVVSQAWSFKEEGPNDIRLDQCPYCKSTSRNPLKIEIHGAGDEQKSRDGLHICHACGKSGRLNDLKSHLGLTLPGVESRKDWSGGQKQIEELPDIDACHQALLEDENAMDYLMNGRGFSREIIERAKLGIVPDRFFREAGRVKALVYPYLVNGQCVFVHFRTLPDMNHPGKVPKAFNSPRGWEPPLYNGEVLRPGIKEVFFVEGEANTIAAMDKGVETICGVPGANFKKAEWIETLDKLETLEKIYICYDMDRAGQRAAQVLASRIGIERCWKIKLPDFTVVTDAGESRKGKDLNEWFTQGGGTAEAFETLKDEAELFDVDGVASSKDALQELYDELLGKGTIEPKYKTQWPDLNKLVGIDTGDVIDILAPEKIGKGGLTTTPVLLANGSWKTMGNLSVGDKLASTDGEDSEVTGVFHRGVLPMYKVTFSDGRSTTTTSDHLWKVSGATKWERQESRIYTTDAIANEYLYPGCRRNQKLYVPLISGRHGDKSALPLHPWMLGAMIGDGCMTDGTLSYATNDKELVDRMDFLGYTLTKPNGINYRFVDSAHVRFWLKKLGLYGHIANSKFIPKRYLESDVESRWELLRGLMDTDGTAGNKHGVLSYCTVSKRLAEDFVYLVRSLGGIAKVGKPQKKSFRYKGEMRSGQDAYIIVARLPEREKAFTLQRKLNRVKERENQPRLTFEKIEYCGDHEAVCISVSHPSKLYVTDDFIVTHNTTFAMNLVEHMVNTYGEDGVMICLEMTRAKLTRKWLCHKAQIADNIPNTPEEAKALLDEFLTSIPQVQQQAANRDGDIFFCLPKYKTTDDIYNLIRQIIRRYGVKWIVFDNLHRLADTTPTPNGKNRSTHLSEISKVFSQIAKEYDVQIVRILQPHRIGDGRIATSDNTDGSAQIAKDCDCHISLHRQPVGEMHADKIDEMIGTEQTASFDDKTLVSVGLSRYSGGGRTWLMYDGARSTFNEFTSAAQALINKELNKDVGYAAINASLGIPAPTATAPESSSGEITP